MSRVFTSTATAQQVLDDIKKGEYNEAKAYGLLNQIINDLPRTKVAKEAKKYKDEHY